MLGRDSGPGGTGNRAGLAVIVLGAAVRPDGTASVAMRRRVSHAVAFAHETVAAVLVLSGGYGKRHPPGAMSEARLMAALVARESVPSDIPLLMEERSSDTLGNAWHSLALLEGHAVARVIVVTDRPHLTRALWCFRWAARRRGLAVVIEGAGVPIPDRRVALAAGVREALALVVYAPRLWRAGNSRGVERRP